MRRWSWTIGRIFGIDVEIHATFFILLAWVAWTHAAHGLAAALEGLALVLAVFAIIVVHELCHALVAKRFSIRTRNIVLLPIGGVASIERMPEKPSQELMVALAGPAVNVVLAALCYAALAAFAKTSEAGELDVVRAPVLAKLLWINLSLAAFNLLPAFPMDGGRALRALLAFRMNHARATAVAARIGQGIALIMGVAGMLWNPMLLLIALFVWIGAQTESAEVQLRSALKGVPVRDAMITEFKALAPADPLSRAVGLAVASSQRSFPVVQDEHPVGIVSVQDIVKTLARDGGGDTPQVREAMRDSFATVDQADMLDDAVRRLQAHEIEAIMVLDGGRLTGMLTAENIGEFVMLKGALEAARRS